MTGKIKTAIERAIQDAGGLQSVVYDSIAPNVCTECGHEGCPAEPDAENYTCEACGSEARSSVLVLLGFM